MTQRWGSCYVRFTTRDVRYFKPRRKWTSFRLIRQCERHERRTGRNESALGSLFMTLPGHLVSGWEPLPTRYSAFTLISASNAAATIRSPPGPHFLVIDRNKFEMVRRRISFTNRATALPALSRFRVQHERTRFLAGRVSWITSRERKFWEEVREIKRTSGGNPDFPS